ncbi:MAG TPA: tRNA preQ1(34) S-adenosylmethionine ribosyltransferase-isomerase QueA [Acidimicrobiales bacterium]
MTDSSFLAAYDYLLPPGAIAQEPVEPRSSARLLVDLARAEDPTHVTVEALPDVLGAGDVVVVNETRVLPARLRLRKATGGEAEVLLLERAEDGEGDAERWIALVRPSRRLPAGTVLLAADGTPVVEIGEHAGEAGGGARQVRLLADLDRHGVVPLPPYIDRPLTDPGRYQTVYARTPGSVAAPTAGLHLTDAVLDRLRAKGIAVHTVDLAVGLATFRPIATERIDDHTMHTERYHVPAETLAACRDATGRVVAVGTTAVRALESAAVTGLLEGRTDLFIRPGFRFQVVDVLLTNFHMPRSSLLVLLAAFAGGDRWRRLYDDALASGYRFLSFGDAMLVSRG